MSVLPITKDTIVYGSGDAGRTMQNSNAVFADKMKLAAKLLNLKPHFVFILFIYLFILFNFI